MLTPSSKKLGFVHSELRQAVLSGEFKTGEKLPTEATLALRFECSIGTVSKTIALLAQEGLVVRRSRAGTTVLRNSDQAESPSSARLNAFAFIYPSEKHEGIWRISQGFQDAAHGSNRKVITMTTGVDVKKEAESIGRLSEFDVKGAVLYSNILTPEDQVHISQMLLQSKFPFVLAMIDVPGLGLPAVLYDDFHAGYVMTKHLLDRGARRIGFFSTGSTGNCVLGYRWALEEAGVPEISDAAMIYLSTHSDYADPLREPAELAREFLKGRSSLDGVVCGYDFLAIGMLRAARELGLRVPEDLRVTGIDDFALAASAEVPLTTYRVPYEKIGARAFDVLNATVGNKPAVVMTEKVRGTIVVRQSA